MKREQLAAQMESFEREITGWREKTKDMLAQLQALGGAADLIHELEAQVSKLNTKLVNLTELRHAVLNGDRYHIFVAADALGILDKLQAELDKRIKG